MNPEQYRDELQRLVVGLATKPPTVEQIDAIYETVVKARGLAPAEWSYVINLALAAGRWPSVEAWDKFCDRARAEVRRSAPPPFALPDRIPDGAPDREYAQAWLDLAKALFRGKITKRQAADQLIDLADRFPAMADALVREAAWFADQASLAELPPASGSLAPLSAGALPPAQARVPQESLVLGAVRHSDPAVELSATPEPTADIVPGGEATREEPDDDANPF